MGAILGSEGAERYGSLVSLAEGAGARRTSGALTRSGL